ncbi:MAG: 30S ribosomal protein S20 [Myxococcota bacterium]|nr:30S ribosomal protein S20 [Myxococcota bacterium]
MATHKDAIKRNRQNIKRKAYNKHFKSQMRTATKKFRKAAADQDKEFLAQNFPTLVKLIQKLAQKGIIHKNQANRRVSRLHALMKKTNAA